MRRTPKISSEAKGFPLVAALAALVPVAAICAVTAVGLGIVGQAAASTVSGPPPLADPNGPYSSSSYAVTFDGTASRSSEYAVDGPAVPWDQANTLADAAVPPGCASSHLATITSQVEQTAILEGLGGAMAIKWLGGFQDPSQGEPAQGWQWVTGEEWGYENWQPGEPNNTGPGIEDHLGTGGGGGDLLGTWNDFAGDRSLGYIVEGEHCGHYTWDFGDGTVAPDAGPTPTHTYEAPGSYHVRLTVTDQQGRVAEAATTAAAGCVGNEEELAAALSEASTGDTVRICNRDDPYNLASPLQVKEGVTLAGQTQPGAIPPFAPGDAPVLSQTKYTNTPGGVIQIENADGARVTGLSLRGPDGTDLPGPVVPFQSDSGTYTSTWNTSTVDDGKHVLNAVAIAADGTQTLSASIWVNVKNPPKEGTCPSEGHTLSSPQRDSRPTVSISPAHPPETPPAGEVVCDNVTLTATNVPSGTTKLVFRLDAANQHSAIRVSNSDDVRLDHVDVRNFAENGLGYGVLATTEQNTSTPPPPPAEDDSLDNLVVEDSYFEHNRHGVTSSNNKYITNYVIRDNEFVNQTDAAIDNHVDTVGTKVIGNTITQGYDSQPDADGILMNGLVDFLIEDNDIDMAGFGRHGILVQWTGESTQTEIRGWIRGNRLYDVDEQGVFVSSGADGYKQNDGYPNCSPSWPPKVQLHSVELEGNSIEADNFSMKNALFWRMPPEVQGCGEDRVDKKWKDMPRETTLAYSFEPSVAIRNFVFSSDRDGDDEIWVVNADGANPSQLTNNMRSDTEPAWSPDGGQIAFASLRGDDGDRDIYVMDANGDNQDERLTTDPARDTQPAWSPDGTQIAFTRRPAGEDDEIWVVNVKDPDNAWALTENVFADSQPAWSPDGTQIAFTRRSGGDDDIWVMNVNDPDNAWPITAAYGTNDRDPAWSPDGTKIAFRAQRDGNAEIYKMNPDGTEATNLTEDANDNAFADSRPGWSPDGSEIVFVSDRPDYDGILGHDDEIWVMHADGTDQRQITDNAAREWSPDWTFSAVPHVLAPGGTSTITWSASENGDYTVHAGDCSGPAVASAGGSYTDAPSDTTLQIPVAALPDEGPHTMSVCLEGGAGLVGSASTTIVKDTIPPETTITSAPTDPSDSASATFEFEADEPGSTFECALDGAAFDPCTSPQDYVDLADGEHTFRVRATDAAGNTNPTPTTLSWTIDTDADGVPGDIEDNAPNGGDGNNDGIPDSEQENVASLPSPTGEYATLAAPEGTSLEAVEFVENPSPGDTPPQAEFPAGFVDYELDGLDEGASVIVDLILPPSPELATYWRYGPTPDDTSHHWYKWMLRGQAVTGAEIIQQSDATLVRLHYTDGELGDDDLTANGRIVDPGAPATPTIAGLVNSVEELGLPKETGNALVKKLENAQKSIDKGNTPAACGQLGAFINQVEAQAGKKIEAADAAALIAEAEAIRYVNDCG